MTGPENERELSTISREELARGAAVGDGAQDRRIWSLGSAAVIFVSAVGYLKSILWPHALMQTLPSGEAEQADEAVDTAPHVVAPSEPTMLETGALPKKPSVKGSGTYLNDDQAITGLTPSQLPAFEAPYDAREGGYTPQQTINHFALSPLAQNDNGILDHGPREAAPSAHSHHGSQHQGAAAAVSTTGEHSQAHQPEGQGTPKPSTSSESTPTDAGSGPTEPSKTNRAPIVAGPVTLAPIRMNDIVVIGLASLLAGASDADGDALSVVNLSASSGDLTDNHNGTWTFAAAHDDVSDILFTYHVSDGAAETSQIASLDLLPITTSPSDDHVLVGTDGNDVLAGSSSNDVIYGLGGSDIMSGGDGADTIRGGNAGSVMDGGEGDDTLIGGDGCDVIFGGNGNDHIFGGAGDDVLIGGAGDDVIDGGIGNDIIDAGSGNNVIIGGEGDDDATSAAGSTVFEATHNDGNDHYAAKGGSGIYDMSATSAPAVIDLDAGTAQSAETGHDCLEGIDNAVGSSGDDVFFANAQANTFTGGGGHDRYVFKQLSDAPAAPITIDTITDFEAGDTIDLSELGGDCGHTTRNPIVFGGETSEDRAHVVVKDSVFFSFTSNTEGEHTLVFAHISDDAVETYFSLDLLGHHDLTARDFAGIG